VFPTLEESGLELMRAMLQYDPVRRISVGKDFMLVPPQQHAGSIHLWKGHVGPGSLHVHLMHIKICQSSTALNYLLQAKGGIEAPGL